MRHRLKSVAPSLLIACAVCTPVSGEPLDCAKSIQDLVAHSGAVVCEVRGESGVLHSAWGFDSATLAHFHLTGDNLFGRTPHGQFYKCAMNEPRVIEMLKDDSGFGTPSWGAIDTFFPNARLIGLKLTPDTLRSCVKSATGFKVELAYPNKFYEIELPREKARKEHVLRLELDEQARVVRYGWESIEGQNHRPEYLKSSPPGMPIPKHPMMHPDWSTTSVRVIEPTDVEREFSPPGALQLVADAMARSPKLPVPGSVQAQEAAAKILGETKGEDDGMPRWSVALISGGGVCIAIGVIAWIRRRRG